MYNLNKIVCLLLVFISPSLSQDTFTNPIFDGNSPDPAVLHLGDYYYLALSTSSEHSLTIHKSRNLTNFRNAEKKVVFRVPDTYYDLWAPEIQKIDNELLIYFTYQGNGEQHRMYVIKAQDPNDPMGSWGRPIKVMEYGGIDGTVMRHGDGNMYYIFCGGARLWIARMVNTSYVDESTLIILRDPQSDWECRGMNGRLCMSEGPYVIYNRNVSYLMFSASETFSPHYCLGMMSIDADKNPLDPNQWWQGPDGPVFERNDEEDVYCTGHAMFTTSPDYTETWMVYHATDSSTNINGNRVARIDKITWGEDGKPVFPRAHGFNHPQPVPSGQGMKFHNNH